jgi:type 1 glutamine amidotransferase
MKSKFIRYFMVITALALSFIAKPEKIKTLIVTGQNNHQWEVSSIALQKILENSELFKVDVSVSPREGQDMSQFTPAFKSYQLVVLDYNGDEWNDATKENFTRYAADGGGIIIYHAANNAFPRWKAYNEITGLGGWGGRDKKSGPYLYWKDGQLYSDPSSGTGGSHGAAHEYTLTARDTENPITNGLPQNWKHATDELYDRLRGPGNINALYTAYSDGEKGGSGREEPLVFTVNYQKARIFHITLGHAGKTLEDNPAMQCAGFQTLLLRGCEWAATGQVTQEIPDDFPTKDRTSLRRNYKRYPKQMAMRPEMSEYWEPQPAIVTPGFPTVSAYMTAPSDAIVLFDGKDLSKWQKRNGEPAAWDVHDGIVTVVAPAGDIRTKDEFRDFQLHIEWTAPVEIVGKSQGRGNSGIFLQGLYEVQVLDTYNNETYANGGAGSIYKQSPPLVNPIRKPGEWNAYDIIFTAPTFARDGNYRTPPVVTVIFNGVIVQNSTIIQGTTEYIGFPKIVQRDRGPIILQTHGNPVGYRNIWIREL